MKNVSIVAAVVGFISVTAVAAKANATNQVFNPDEYYIDAPASIGANLYTAGAVQLSLVGTDVIDWYINADGSVTFYSSGFPVSDAGFKIGTSEVYAQLIMVSTNTANYFYDPGLDVSYSMTARLKYTSVAITAVCQTPTFTVSLTTDGTVTENGNMYAGAAFNATTGVYIEVGQPTIPSMTSGCDNAPERSTINGYMAGTAAIVLGQSATNPQLLQPI